MGDYIEVDTSEQCERQRPYHGYACVTEKTSLAGNEHKLFFGSGLRLFTSEFVMQVMQVMQGGMARGSTDRSCRYVSFVHILWAIVKGAVGQAC